MNEIKSVVNANYTELTTKNIATFGLTDNQTVNTTNETTIVLNQTINSIGSGFSLSSGKIVIGSGINYVKVSCNVIFNTFATNGLRRIMVYKGTTGGDTSVARSMAYYTQNFDSAISITPMLIPVSEGDTIYFTTRNAGNSTVYNSTAGDTYFTVEAV